MPNYMYKKKNENWHSNNVELSAYTEFYYIK